MTSQFRVQVLGLLGGEVRTILWVRQDLSAIRSGLALPGTDLHVTLREGEGTHHSGKGAADLSAAVTYTPGSATLDPKRTEVIGYWTLSNLQADFSEVAALQARCLSQPGDTGLGIIARASRSPYLHHGAWWSLHPEPD